MRRYPVSYSAASILRTACRGCGTAAVPDADALGASGGGARLFVSDPAQAAIITIYLLGTTAVALVVHDLGTIISVVGAVACTGLVLVAPAACYRSLVPFGPPATRAAAGAMVVTGLVLTPVLVALQLV